MTKNRKIYDQDYYKIQLIINDPKFKNAIKKLTKTFADFGCPIPEKGLKSYKDYMKWNDKYFNKRAKIEYSRIFKDKINKITSGKDSWGAEEQEIIEKLRNKELPPVYGEDINNLLNEFGIHQKHKNYKNFRDFITEYLFYGTGSWTILELICCYKDCSHPKYEIVLFSE